MYISLDESSKINYSFQKLVDLYIFVSDKNAFNIKRFEKLNVSLNARKKQRYFKCKLVCMTLCKNQAIGCACTWGHQISTIVGILLYFV